MSSVVALTSVGRLLPGVTIETAGVFGVQDQDLAAGLLGRTRVLASQAGIAVPVAVAVSASAIHICDWDHAAGAATELARFDRATTTVTIDTYRSERRVCLVDQRSGYQLPLTATVSRWSPYGPGALAVIRSVSGP